jgi:hypothetical protein
VPNIPSEAERAVLIRRVSDEAQKFFAARPDRNLYAGYLGNTETGAWAYLVMERSGPYGAFDFEPPSDEFTCEQFTTLLNAMPRGEQVMKESIEKVSGTLRGAIDSIMRQALTALPAGPSRH